MDTSESKSRELYAIYHTSISRKKFVDRVLGQTPIHDQVIAEIIWECIDRAVDDYQEENKEN